MQNRKFKISSGRLGRWPGSRCHLCWRVSQLGQAVEGQQRRALPPKWVCVVSARENGTGKFRNVLGLHRSGYNEESKPKERGSVAEAAAREQQ